MTDEQRLVSIDDPGRELNTRSQTRQRVLDVAIVRADISEVFEECSSRAFLRDR